MADRMQTLREVYQNLSHTSTPDWPQHKDVDSGRADKAEARGHSRRRSRQTEESEALERDFAMAVFEIGLRQSSPKVLKGLMLPCPEALTTEHIKSHLQKYRLHYERSKEEFLGHYRKYLRVSSPDDESRRYSYSTSSNCTTLYRSRCTSSCRSKPSSRS
ncbi:hypothetical protein M885DRAFT_138825 [Pelagophyceae sp. CCMP2097]|nr:hypothetical protein M885DRAFT_138825 [Pelagophyceae sp. CCMP2097]